MYSVNSRSALNKWLEIILNANSMTFDAIGTREIWFSNKDDGVSYNIPGYSSFIAFRAGRRGGGVLSLIKFMFRPKLLFVSEPTRTLNYAIIKVSAASKLNLSCNSLQTSDSTSDDLGQFKENMASLDNEANITLMGNLNLPNILWPNAAILNLTMYIIIFMIFVHCMIYFKPSWQPLEE